MSLGGLRTDGAPQRERGTLADSTCGDCLTYLICLRGLGRTRHCGPHSELCTGNRQQQKEGADREADVRAQAEGKRKEGA